MKAASTKAAFFIYKNLSLDLTLSFIFNDRFNLIFAL